MGSRTVENVSATPVARRTRKSRAKSRLSLSRYLRIRSASGCVWPVGICEIMLFRLSRNEPCLIFSTGLAGSNPAPPTSLATVSARLATGRCRFWARFCFAASTGRTFTRFRRSRGCFSLFRGGSPDHFLHSLWCRFEHARSGFFYSGLETTFACCFPSQCSNNSSDDSARRPDHAAECRTSYGSGRFFGDGWNFDVFDSLFVSCVWFFRHNGTLLSLAFSPL